MAGLTNTAKLAVTFDGVAQTLYLTSRGYLPEYRDWQADMAAQGGPAATFLRPPLEESIPVGRASSITLGSAVATSNTGPNGSVRVLTVTDGDGARTYALPTVATLRVHCYQVDSSDSPAGTSYVPLPVGRITAFTFTA
jgi:hypothetical protein